MLKEEGLMCRYSVLTALKGTPLEIPNIPDNWDNMWPNVDGVPDSYIFSLKAGSFEQIKIHSVTKKQRAEIQSKYNDEYESHMDWLFNDASQNYSRKILIRFGIAVAIAGIATYILYQYHTVQQDTQARNSMYASAPYGPPATAYPGSNGYFTDDFPCTPSTQIVDYTGLSATNYKCFTVDSDHNTTASYGLDADTESGKSIKELMQEIETPPSSDAGDAIGLISLKSITVAGIPALEYVFSDKPVDASLGYDTSVKLFVNHTVFNFETVYDNANQQPPEFQHMLDTFVPSINVIP